MDGGFFQRKDIFVVWATFTDNITNRTERGKQLTDLRKISFTCSDMDLKLFKGVLHEVKTGTYSEEKKRKERMARNLKYYHSEK